MLSLHPHVRVWIGQAGRSLRRCCGKNHLIKLHVVRFRRDCVDKLHAEANPDGVRRHFGSYVFWSPGCVSRVPFGKPLQECVVVPFAAPQALAILPRGRQTTRLTERQRQTETGQHASRRRVHTVHMGVDAVPPEPTRSHGIEGI